MYNVIETVVIPNHEPYPLIQSAVHSFSSKKKAFDCFERLKIEAELEGYKSYETWISGNIGICTMHFDSNFDGTTLYHLRVGDVNPII